MIANNIIRLLITVQTFVLIITCPLSKVTAQNLTILKPENFKAYIDEFNKNDKELYSQFIVNDSAWSFLSSNIPFLECPDKNIELTYYFRWWTYRKHIKSIPEGFVITEFLPPVPWSGKQNTIGCAVEHHFREGRWLRDSKYLLDYANFWVYHAGMQQRGDESWPHVLDHGNPLAASFYNFHMVHPQKTFFVDRLSKLIEFYEELKFRRQTEIPLYWSMDGGPRGDGMEIAIGGPGVRPTFNSYLYAQACAISEFLTLGGLNEQAEKYRKEAESIQQNLVKYLWDQESSFFKVLRFGNPKERELTANRNLADVVELIGFVPWAYNVPPKNRNYEKAWLQLMDSEGFFAPYGPTTAEQRHSNFKISYIGHECQWNGPSWPYATSQTLTALANVLNNYHQEYISKEDYFTILSIYTKSHQIIKEDGSIIPWIDENINPYTGDWIARTRLMAKELWPENKAMVERGKDYNHSTYVDLIITGLIGLRPSNDNVIEINPLLPSGTWDWFCLDGVYYKGMNLTILYDKFGTKYNKGKGFSLYINGELKYNSKELKEIFLIL